MESIHGIDVSWIHNTANKDGVPRHVKEPPPAASPTAPQTTSARARSNSNGKRGTQTGDGDAGASRDPAGSLPRQIPQRPGFQRGSSSERNSLLPSGAKSPTTRRNSWLSSISSKFSSSTSPQNTQNTTLPAPNTITQPAPEPRVATFNPHKGAVLQHGSKHAGADPYTPAPVKSGQNGFLQSALRRLSSSGGQLSTSGNKLQHGLCERRVLNVDHQRERCKVNDLEPSKLRRVAFCVDVEIAGGPKYYDEGSDENKKEKKEKKKLAEKGEGEALKHPEEVKDDKETDGVVHATGEVLPKEPRKEGSENNEPPSKIVTTLDAYDDDTHHEVNEEISEKDKDKKKEKKKRSEEERKARKEKKRKQAEANGTLPVEVVWNGSETSLDTPSRAGTPKIQGAPTTDPARIYRRCCQLRETPILKKITEQLSAPMNCDKSGVVTKLDLSGYWMQLQDLITLGDYLAVVPVKELIMEGCGLTDEGVRVILAGLLAAKSPEHSSNKRPRADRTQKLIKHSGVIERVVLKNNAKIGRDGWQHVCLFIHMSRSLKALDMSMNPFPQQPPSSPTSDRLQKHTTPPQDPHGDLAAILSKAIAERLGGHEFELFNMAETGLTSEQLDLLINGVIKSGLRRLGLAGNNLTAEGMTHVTRFLKDGNCQGLDLGGNQITDHLDILAEALDENCALWALSIANCGLTYNGLWKLFPCLPKLRNFRFIDLSHNPELFSASPSAITLLRKYLPRMPVLKRIHLTDVSMTPEQAIALAEILPESPSLAHVNIMDNPEIAALASAKEEERQEEACAVYASLMAAVRVSKTIICIDIEVPGPESSEVVIALAKQVVAYCLRNMERGPVAEIAEAVSISGPNVEEKEVAVPEVLLHLVGHVEGFHENHDEDEPAPDQDYVIGGTGVVKALGICLRNSTNDLRRPSADRTNSEMSPSGVETPKSVVSGGKAKDMSKNLLGSARKIRARLQPALAKEARMSDRNAYQRLLFLDSTLERMIQRFEDEYPETRLQTQPRLDIETASPPEAQISDPEPEFLPAEGNNSDEEESLEVRPNLSRRSSDVSLAAKALSQEEGEMLRFGQRFRRDLLGSELEDHLHGTTGHEIWAPHLEMLRATIEELGGEEIRKKIEEGGQAAVLKELSEEASWLKERLIESDPEHWEAFRAAQETAMRNARVEGPDNMSAIE